MNRTAGRINIPIAIASLAISLLLFVIVLPNWMLRRVRPFTVMLTSVPYGFDSKHFYIDKQPTAIVVHANVSDQEYEQLSGSATAEANLIDAQPGTHSYPVSIYPDKFRKLVQEQNPQVSFTLEALKSHLVPIVVIGTGKPKDPTQIVENIKPEIRMATIDGPESSINRVVSATASVKLESLDPHSPQQMAELVPVDAKDAPVDHVDIHPVQVLVTGQFSLSPQQKQVFVEASFDDHELPPGYQVKNYFVEPKRAIATGSGLGLSRLGGTVRTEKIDVSKVTRSQTLLVPIKNTGMGVSFEPASVRVTIIVEPITLNGLSPKPRSNRPSAQSNNPSPFK